MTKMVATTIYGKRFEKNILLKNEKSYDLETRHAPLGSQGLQGLYDDPGLTFIYFTARSYFAAYVFVWEKLFQSLSMGKTCSK